MKTKNILPLPGVYIFKDKEGNALYVGKAKNLKKRIFQYFKSASLKIKNLLDSAEDIETIYTQNEAEAILKESDLIKKLNPPFNQLLRDDTKYFYLIFTKEEFPKVFITHQPEKFKTKEIIGPFIEGSSLKTILNTLRKDIPFCTCREKHLRSCLNAQLGLCFGFCCAKESIGENKKKLIEMYEENIKLIRKIFQGNLKNLRKEILQEIKKALKKNDLEKAQKLKKIYLSIKKIEENQELIKEKDSLLLEHERRKILSLIQKTFNLEKLPRRIEVIDISHLAGKEKVGVLVTFIDGEYIPTLLRKFKIKTVLKPDDPRMIYEILKRRLKHKEWGHPDIFLIDGGKIQFKFAKKAILEEKLKIKVISLAKPKEEIFYKENKSIELKKFPLLRNFFLSLDQKAHNLALKYLHQRLK